MSLFQFYTTLLPSSNREQQFNNILTSRSTRTTSETANHETESESSAIRTVQEICKLSKHPIDYLGRGLESLLKILEESFLCSIQSTHDASELVRISKIHARLMLLRPTVLYGVRQLCFVWSEARLWRSNKLAAVYVQFSILKNGTIQTTDVHVRCNCAKFLSPVI